ncbi:reverse transcriptase-like protein, partial [Undibacterium sp. 5I1]
MPTHDQLLAIAFKAELAKSQRLAKANFAESKSLEQAQEHALEKILFNIAGEKGLENLIAARLLEQEKIRARHIVRQQLQAEKLAQHKKSNAQSNKQSNCAVNGLGADTWQAYFDGSAHPNPGKIGIGGVVVSPSGIKIEISRAMGYGDSNEAEFYALNAVLACALEQRPAKLVVFGDSRTVIDSVNADHTHSKKNIVHLPACSTL